MGGKNGERVTVRLSEETKAWLDDEVTLNTSALLRDLLDTYRLAGDTEEASLQRRMSNRKGELQQLRMKKAHIETEIEKKQRRIEDLQERIKKRQQSVPEEVIEFAEGIRSGRFQEAQLDADNAAIENWASKAGIPIEEFIEQVEVRL